MPQPADGPDNTPPDHPEPDVLKLDPDHPEVARHRSECPVTRTASGIWFLASYAAVHEATAKMDLFVDGFRESGRPTPPEQRFIHEIREPEHSAMRRVIHAALAPSSLRWMPGFTQEVCGELLDKILAEDGPVDLVATYADPALIRVTARLFGVADDRMETWVRWAEGFARRKMIDRGKGLSDAATNVIADIDAVIAAKRTDPADDFISRMQRPVEGYGMTDLQIRTQFVFFLVAATGTTTQLVANLIWQLCARPDVQRRVRDDRTLVPALVEEVLRAESPDAVILRRTAEPVEVAGVTIPAGERVAFGLASANRDPAEFPDPDTFRLDRQRATRHMAFGFGPRICSGAPTARMIAAATANAFLDRVADARLAPDHQFVNVTVPWAHSPETIDALLTAAPA
ncbi:MAG: cytochrome P450 [Streptomycetaceae bacterium]|nr:cytochrome P450 [Streptomycetaceae bacterium]